MRYTIDDVPPKLHEALHDRARSEGKSLDQVVIDALSKAMNVTMPPAPRPPRRDLRDLIGTMTEEDARIIEQVTADSDAADIEAQLRGER